MTLQTSAYLPALPGNVTPNSLQTLQESTAAREALLRQIVKGFERKYGCSLETFERRLARRQAPEHPGWEDSIEWRNAVEEIEPSSLIGDPERDITTVAAAVNARLQK